MAFCAKTIDLTNVNFANCEARTCTINFESNLIDVTPFDPAGSYPYGLQLSCSPKLTVTLTSNENTTLFPGDNETITGTWNGSTLSIPCVVSSVTWDGDASKEGAYTTVLAANGSVTIT